MGIVNDIKKQAQKNGTVIQSSEAQELWSIINNAFLLQHDIDNEVKFLKMVMTRGSDTQERVGLHASSMLISDSAFCCRQQVLSLVYRQVQKDNVSIPLLRIFEEGNAIHEKWQRLFIRAGWSKWDQLDFTQYCDEYKMSFTPDIICKIPEFYDGEMIGEIKSVNTFQYKRMTRHPSAWKQCQWYMHMTGLKKGFVLCEDKNNQEFKLEVYDYDPSSIEQFIDRADEVIERYNHLVNDHKMVGRPNDASSPDCKRCKECAMRDACWNIGMGRVKIVE
jgi:hypothetical protein